MKTHSDLVHLKASREYPCEFQGGAYGGTGIRTRLCASAVHTIRDAGIHMHAAGYGVNRLTDTFT